MYAILQPISTFLSHLNDITFLSNGYWNENNKMNVQRKVAVEDVNFLPILLKCHVHSHCILVKKSTKYALRSLIYWIFDPEWEGNWILWILFCESYLWIYSEWVCVARYCSVRTHARSSPQTGFLAINVYNTLNKVLKSQIPIFFVSLFINNTRKLLNIIKR